MLKTLLGWKKGRGRDHIDAATEIRDRNKGEEEEGEGGKRWIERAFC